MQVLWADLCLKSNRNMFFQFIKHDISCCEHNTFIEVDLPNHLWIFLDVGPKDFLYKLFALIDCILNIFFLILTIEVDVFIWNNLLENLTVINNQILNVSHR